MSKSNTCPVVWSGYKWGEISRKYKFFCKSIRFSKHFHLCLLSNWFHLKWIEETIQHPHLLVAPLLYKRVERKEEKNPEQSCRCCLDGKFVESWLRWAPNPEPPSLHWLTSAPAPIKSKPIMMSCSSWNSFSFPSFISIRYESIRSLIKTKKSYHQKNSPHLGLS